MKGWGRLGSLTSAAPAMAASSASIVGKAPPSAAWRFRDDLAAIQEITPQRGLGRQVARVVRRRVKDGAERLQGLGKILPSPPARAGHGLDGQNVDGPIPPRRTGGRTLDQTAEARIERMGGRRGFDLVRRDRRSEPGARHAGLTQQGGGFG